MKGYRDEIFRILKKPSRYLGREPYFPLKDWEKAKVKLCLCYPDLYEVGRSHLGINILSSIVNSQVDYICDLAFAVAKDMEGALRSASTPLLSTNYQMPLSSFDVIGISYAYELLVTGILQILDLSGIPLRAEEREKGYPIILGGGPSSENPEPIAEVFDAWVIGEAETAILEILDLVRLWKEDGTKDKHELLKGLARIDGVYVPLFKNAVKRRIFLGFSEGASHSLEGIPIVELSHDRLAVEISRGCTRGCRFCSAGFFYRPVREKPPEVIVEEILQGFKRTGYREASLMSLSTGDYTRLQELVSLLQRTFYQGKAREYAFSLPSLRVGSLTQDLLNFLRQGRTTTLTFAVEAGSERLRGVINKDIDLEALFQDLILADRYGFRRIKVYFMVGLPTEEREDLEEIIRLYKDIKKALPRIELTFSASIFIPKPHTPFQWLPQVDIPTAKEKLSILKGALKRGFKHHDPSASFLEGVIARGGRELLPLIELAYRRGARLDAWSDHLDLDLWMSSAEELGIELSSYLRERSFEERLPWEHIDIGVKREFLIKELEKAKAGRTTKDCRFSRCPRCGVCQGKIRNDLAREMECNQPAVLDLRPKEDGEFWYLLLYTKLGKAKYLSQLEVMRLFELVLRRNSLPISYTEGFNPRPKMMAGMALPVGVESEGEYLAVALYGNNHGERLKGLEVYEGLRIVNVVSITKERPMIQQEEMVFYLKPLSGAKLRPLNGEGFVLQEKNSEYELIIKGRELGLMKVLREILNHPSPLETLAFIKKSSP